MKLNRFHLLLAALASLCLAACQRESAPAEPLEKAMQDSAVEHAVKHADPTYVCPMHPQIARDAPGNCPICGMALVRRDPEVQAAGEAPVVSVSPQVQQSLGVRTAPVKRETLWRRIDTLGQISYDEKRVVHVHPRAAGWVEALHVRTLGERVKKGQLLLEYYAPDILAAQEELLVAGQAGTGLAQSARQRLKQWAVADSFIREVERSGKAQRRVPLYAPADGVVAAISLREGMYVTPETELFTLGDIATVWATVEIYEHQLNWVSVGRPVEVRVEALPGRVFEGEVEYVYPELDPRTRTLRARLKIANKESLLKPNMYADVTLFGGALRDVLAVPREALILTGRGARVIRRMEGGGFQPVEVTPGAQAQDLVEILKGLAEGDEVVISGQFLIDSEASLQASFGRMASEAPAAPPPPAGGHVHNH